MSRRSARATLSNDLRSSMIDAGAYSLMVGMGETYLTAFALALSISEIATGLLAAFPMLFGATLQLAAPWCIGRLGSHRIWIVSCAIAQAVCLFVMPIAAIAGRWQLAVLYIAASLYWASGLATGPAWNTWAEEIIPPIIRTRFFAFRSRVSQFCLLVGFAAGGLVLAYAKRNAFVVAAFTAIFILSGISRLVSASALYRQSEPSAGRAARGHKSLRHVLLNLRGHAGGRLLMYLFAVQVAVQLSGPYFTPFMLARRGMTYTEYMFLIALGFLGKVIALPAWGRLAKRAGVQPLMWIGGVGIVPLSGCWLGLQWIEHDVLYLSVVQVLGGFAWAAYELAFFLMFFETIPRHERTSVLTIYNFTNALALVFGASLGAGWLALVGESGGSYLQLFGLSSAARLLALVFLMRVPQMEIRAVAMSLRTLALRPSEGGSLDRPVLSTIEDDQAEKVPR
ncbi:MAG: MFS transporter [Planctomycetaceae bacterium]|nr:MFS transporter [Planctomycetales bacterium]MCB9926841.1 MFS transporter [Planctomycetaceae bacterium]